MDFEIINFFYDTPDFLRHLFVYTSFRSRETLVFVPAYLVPLVIILHVVALLQAKRLKDAGG